MNIVPLLPPLSSPGLRPACCDSRVAHLQVRDLAVSYRGVPAVHRVNIDVPCGCITAIVGPSGCGKSSFLASLNRMTDLVPDCRVSGQLHFAGNDIHDSRTDLISLRRRIGMIFQRPNPFPLSILENLTFPLRHHGVSARSEREARAEMMLRRVGLWDEVSNRLKSPAQRLSGGQQQRLCLARALLLEPEVLLLDEPCSALDPIASAVVEDLILSLRSTYTVVIVTHNLAQARRIADNVAMFWLDDGAGTIVEQGPVKAIFDSPGNDITAAYVRGMRG